MGDKGHLRVDVANLARSEPDKYSGEADMSKDTLGPESSEELRRSRYVEGQTRKAEGQVIMKTCPHCKRKREVLDSSYFLDKLSDE
ncbi:hypothetical protein Tco_1072012 [Tanacetum coccineum]